MSRLLRSSVSVLVLTAAVGLGSAAPARAQAVYGGIGPGPVGVYGGFGYFPGAYNGFWSNGFSLYGPPVPTYGIVPGVFGGADQRLGNFPLAPNIQIYNGASIGLGTPGAGGAGPRRRHLYEGAGMAGATPTLGQATVEVRVPVANAEVFFEGINTRQNGLQRQFLSPPIVVGQTLFYKVQARWKQDGKDVDQTRSVGVRANETVVVDFTQNQPAPANVNQPLLGGMQ
jgi:uncharacterized protein (TIGR03000 family)